jgi:hypothetical protein
MTNNNQSPVIGIIGGSGVYDIVGLTNKRWERVHSPFGEASDELLFGELDGQPMVFLLYVACPLSTIDMSIPNGAAIPIEERAADEVTGFRECQWAAMGVKVRNPAFDVTPAELVKGLITEKGVVSQPNIEKIAGLFTH